MRVLLVILLSVIAALSATPYWFGIEAETTYRNIVEEVSESGNTTVTKKSYYNRGWLNSTAETVFEIHGGTQKLASIRVNDKISHGPIPLNELLSGDFKLKPVQAIVNSMGKVAGSIKGDSENGHIR